MSDDNKNLSDDLNDMLGDAKEGAKKAADKVNEKANEFAEDAKEFAGDAKEKASEFAEEAKASAKEFANDAKEVFSDGKNVAIIAHLTVIGWIVALIMNNNQKSDLGSFYLRQVLGIILVGFVCAIIPLVNLVAWILPLAMWIMSIVGAFSGEKKPVFLLGNQFQDWFKSL